MKKAEKFRQILSLIDFFLMQLGGNSRSIAKVVTEANPDGALASLARDSTFVESQETVKKRSSLR